MNVRGIILPLRILGVIGMFTAIVPLGIAAFSYRSTSSFLSTAVRTQATVTELRPSSESGLYSTVFEFNDSSGARREHVSDWATNAPRDRPGDTIDVVYDPTDPFDVRVDRYWSLWLTPTACCLASLAPITFGLLMIWFLPWVIRRVFPAEDIAGASGDVVAPH